MIHLPVLEFEISVAILLAGAILCAKPEYGLFVYGFALGFPDLALPLGAAINLRLDDVLILLFLIRTVLWTPAPLAPGQRKILGWQVLLLAACLLSAGYETLGGAAPPIYETAKMAGCAVILFVLPRLVQSERRLGFLVAGLVCGGAALAVQIFHRVGGISANSPQNFQEFKSAAAFATWNPNTIGQASMLMVFAAGLGGILFAKSRAGKLFWPCLAVGFALIPSQVFVRGATLSIAAGILLFCCLARYWNWILVFLLLCLSVVFFVRAANPQLFAGATQVDLSTGEGLSHRMDRWEMAIGAIASRPIAGQGFGQEWVYLSGIGSEGRAHNAYLTVWLEMGIGGLALLLAVVSQIGLVGLSLYRQPQFRLQGALLLSLLFALCLDSLGLPTLYWEKLPTIAIAVGVALVGICERTAFETAPQELSALDLESLPQHS
ncbi:MAG: O-antigen ligase family protein [Acidobacteriia bacterium]|nr:O-antigen ligase family protein [Terriglobia bacterium]